MLSLTGLTLTLAAFLSCTPANASPQFQSSIQHNPIPRQASGPDMNGTAALLEPVVPPAVDEDALSVLKLAKNITLAWAGSSNANTTTNGQFKRDAAAVLSQADFTFRYPTVPLDHSNFVSDIACSGGKLTGRLTDKAYTYAKKQWAGAGQVVFITSVDGCGQDAANDYFLARAITFSDKTKTFTAQGSEAGYKDVGVRFKLSWGDIGALPLKRALNKREMFEPHPLHERGTLDFSFEFSQYLDRYLGVASDAPWDHAVQLAKFGKEGGKEDKAWQKGELKKPTSKVTGPQKGKMSGSVDYGMKLYCVECGFGGGATIYGTMDVSILSFSVDTLEAGFNMHLIAGLNLGMEAYVQYEKVYTKELARVNLAGWKIPLLADVGPFISLSAQAGMKVKATGALLIGTNVAWDNVQVNLNFLDSSRSYSRGWKPRFVPRAEVQGQLAAEASIGLPLKLGLGVNILSGLWEADASIVDTPQMVAEAKFVTSAAISSSGEAVPDFNGGCYGIAWNIHFENTLQAVFQGEYIGSKAFDLIKPYESEPIANGCIGYQDPGIDDGLPKFEPKGKGSGTGLGGNGLNSGGSGLSGGGSSGSKGAAKGTTSSAAPAPTGVLGSTRPNCTPGQVLDNPAKARDAICSRYVTSSQLATSNRPRIYQDYDSPSAAACGADCLRENGCASYGYTNKGKCALLKLPIKSIATVGSRGSPDWQFWDASCIKISTCP